MILEQEEDKVRQIPDGDRALLTQAEQGTSCTLLEKKSFVKGSHAMQALVFFPQHIKFRA